MSAREVIDCIRKNKTFLITTHQNLEGDALGSEIAFAYLLRKLGKPAVIVNQDPLPSEYAFLKGSRRIKRYRKDLKVNFDVLVFLDCSDIARSGVVSNLLESYQPIIINIDHHISNAKFGNVNWVCPSASSVCEMLYLLIKRMSIKLDAVVAQALYVGMLTDTGSFRYPNTTSLTHQAIAELLKFNLNVYKTYQYIYESIPFSDMELLAQILRTMKQVASGKIITFEIKRRFLEGKSVSFDLTENVLNFGRAIRGAEVCVLFKEQFNIKSKEIRVNLRSPGEIDVNRIAQSFGGGGHRTASGCTVKGSLQTVKQKVINKIKEQL